jgi:hypothetical protein
LARQCGRRGVPARQARHPLRPPARVLLAQRPAGGLRNRQSEEAVAEFHAEHGIFRATASRSTSSSCRAQRQLVTPAPTPRRRRRASTCSTRSRPRAATSRTCRT